MSGYDHICSSPQIIQIVFKKAGITSAIEDGVEQTALVADTTMESDKDPFDSDIQLYIVNNTALCTV